MKEKITPDIQKANALILIAQTTQMRLSEISLEKYPSNSLVDLYDILHKYIDAIFLKKGIKFRGEGAHQELIDESRNLGILTQGDIVLLQQVRMIRNRIQYEGYFVDKEYIIRNKENLLKMIERVKRVHS